MVVIPHRVRSFRLNPSLNPFRPTERRGGLIVTVQRFPTIAPSTGGTALLFIRDLAPLK